jgi:hypothetical protein
VGSDGRAENVQWGTMFCVKGGLEGFGQDIGGVVGGGYSPDSHPSLHVILFDFVVADVNRSGLIGHIGLCSDMLCSLVVRVEIIGVVRVAKKN